MLRFIQSLGLLSLVWTAGCLSPKEHPVESPAVPAPTTFGDFIIFDLVSTDPGQWDAETRKEFFGNMPPEYHQRYLDAYTKLCEASDEYWQVRAELFQVIHPLFKTEKELEEHTKKIAARKKEIKKLKDGRDKSNLEEVLARWLLQKEMLSGDYGASAKTQADSHKKHYLAKAWSEFRQYPELLDPGQQLNFWNELAEETIFLYEKSIEYCLKGTKEQKEQVADFQQRVGEMTREDLPGGYWTTDSFHHPSFFNVPFSLNDIQKARIANDEAPFLMPRFVRLLASDVFLQELRKTELEPWQMDAAPELSELAIDQSEVVRWDGSLSLHPFIRTIAGRCAGVDISLLHTTIHHGSVPTADTGTTLSNTHSAMMALIQGEKDIVFSARRPSKTEMDAVQQSGVELVVVPFAKDAFVFLQNRRNPVRNLTLEQYRGIFSGQYRRWKDVGGFGGDIKPFIRNVNSGSEELMHTLVMQDVAISADFEPPVFSGMSLVFEALENTPGGIAYSIYHYDRYMVFNASTRVMAVDGVGPNAETIASGEYPLVYECVLIHRKNPGEKIERFVRWLLSEEGQKLVRSIGYVPMMTGI